MAQFAESITQLPIVEELKSSAGRGQILQSDVDQLYGLVLAIADAAGPLLSRIPTTFAQYTEHDIGHCRNLLDLCGRFIPPATLKMLNALELTLLVSSILLHDFGMFVSEEEKLAALQSAEFGDYLGADLERHAAIERAFLEDRSWEAEYLRDAALAEYFRRIAGRGTRRMTTSITELSVLPLDAATLSASARRFGSSLMTKSRPADRSCPDTA
jgi:hypothetical protein